MIACPVKGCEGHVEATVQFYVDVLAVKEGFIEEIAPAFSTLEDSAKLETADDYELYCSEDHPLRIEGNAVVAVPDASASSPLS